MKNEFIKLKSYKNLNIENTSGKEYLTVMLDGQKMTTEQDFFKGIVCSFKTPYEYTIENWDDFEDFMTYLFWIEGGKGINLIIFNSNSINVQPEFERSMIRAVLPFWQKDVTEIMVEGKIREFNVYLIEDKDPEANIVDCSSSK